VTVFAEGTDPHRSCNNRVAANAYAYEL